MSGKHASKFERGEFVAWDGEGIGRGRRHSYVLFASSLPGTTLANVRGLGTAQVFDAFLEGVRAAPRAVHVGFAISYDANMIFRDIPKAKLRRLWDSERVTWKRYALEWRPRKFLRMKNTESGATGTWWDVWPFFQTSFVRALEKYGVMTDAMRAEIHAMKLRRARFRARDLDAMTRYNAQECAALVALMESLLASLKSAGLTIARWDGPGAIAAALLKSHDYGETRGVVPDAALTAFQHAYYGGRIECLQYGRTRETIYHYDVNSAYPAAMRTLPCRRPSCGRWHYQGGDKVFAPYTFAVYHVRWNFATAPLHPFPWRSAKGSVYFPPAGEGWVWYPELAAAGMHGTREGAHFRVLGSWRWVRARRCEHTACEWIDGLYHERERAKARGDGAEHAIKLGLNSLYGKLAQRVGAREVNGEVQPPPFFDLAGAGFITSTVRAQLYRAAMQSPHDIIMLATDGIYSRVPLTLPDTGAKKLGEWTAELHTGATVVQSGVYILDNPDGTEHAYTRGFDMDSIDRAKIHHGWSVGSVRIAATHERFLGLGAALASDKRWKLWRTWVKEDRDLALYPWGTKRTPTIKAGGRPANAARGLLTTVPTDTRRFWADFIGGRGMMTTPAPVPWRDPENMNVVEMNRVDRAENESEDARL